MIKDTQSQEYSKAYLEFLQNPSKVIQSIGKDIDSKGLIEDIFEYFSSEQVEKLGINVNKYSTSKKQHLNIQNVVEATEDVRIGEMQKAIGNIRKEMEPDKSNVQDTH